MSYNKIMLQLYFVKIDLQFFVYSIVDNYSLHLKYY